MQKSLIILTATSAFALLSACSGGGGSVPVGGGGGGTTPPPGPTPSYETLDSTADATSTLGGVALRSTNTDFDLVATTGSLTHDTGETTLSDGSGSLTDPDGLDANGQLTDGGSTVTVDDGQLFTGSYEYVRAYQQSYSSGGTNFDATGIDGIVTDAGDVPTSGTATYSGEAIGVVIAGNEGYDLENGSSTVTADFGAGTVDATMTGFTARDHATGNTATAPIDTIAATGMTIAGNGFSGGTVTTTNSGTAVNVTGANTTTAAQGAFFGYDAAASAPDEVGGMVLQQGDDGIVAGAFIAD